MLFYTFGFLFDSVDKPAYFYANTMRNFITVSL